LITPARLAERPEWSETAVSAQEDRVFSNLLEAHSGNEHARTSHRGLIISSLLRVATVADTIAVDDYYTRAGSAAV
jgi:hypothetical protein